MKESLAALCALFTIYCASAAQEMSEEEYLAALDEALPGKLMNNPLDPGWQVHGEGARSKVVDADIPGAKAFQIRVRRAQTNSYDVSVQGQVRDGVTAGETVLVAFWARAKSVDPETGSAHVEFRLQQAGAPYTGIVGGSVMLSEAWQIHYLSGTSGQDYADGGMSAAFNIGHHKQSVELGQYYIMNMGDGVDLSTLPSGSVDP